ncbi:MAG: polymer-forming cytoskeletal protein [Desulfobacterales bacterium]
MLKKNKHQDMDSTVEPEPFPPVVPSPVVQNGKTVIGKQIVIEGGIQGNEDLVVEGTVKGSIDLDKFHLTIGPKGSVESEIRAGNVTVGGRLKGNIHALDRVKITKEADFTGEIHAKRISVEDGAIIKAVIDIARDTNKKVESLIKPMDAKSGEIEQDSVSLAAGADKRK